MKISLFNRCADASPQLKERSWPQIREKIPRPPIRAEKDGALWSPATFDPPHRLLKNVVEVSLLVLDYDHDADFERDLQPWRELCAFAAHTTFSHSEIEHRFRVIIPLARPIPAADFPRLWKWASEISGGKIDPAASDASRMFYVPGRKSEVAPYLYEVHEGSFLDWGKLDLPVVSKPVLEFPVQQDGQAPLGGDEWLERARKATNWHEVERLWLGDYSGYRSQSEATLALCSHLAFYLNRDPQKIDAAFRQSGLMRPKWDRKDGDGTWGSRTIGRVLSTPGEVYSGNGHKPHAATSTDHQKKPEHGFTLTPIRELLSEPDEQVSYVLDKTLPRGGTSALCAKPKVCKTTTAESLSVAVSRGKPFLGRQTTKGPVLFLSLEAKRSETREHFRRLGATENIYVHVGAAPERPAAALKILIDQYEPVLVIIDPLSRFVQIRDFNSYGEVISELEPILDLARTSKCQPHIMFLHHNGKGGDLRDGGDAVLGSTALFGIVDTLLTGRKRERVRTIESTQRYGEDLPETILHLDPDTGMVDAAGDLKTFTLNERKKAVLEAVGSEPLTDPAIRELVGGTNGGLTTKALRALFEEGALHRSGLGKKGDPFLYAKDSQPQSIEELPSVSVEPTFTEDWRREAWDSWEGLAQ